MSVTTARDTTPGPATVPPHDDARPTRPDGEAAAAVLAAAIGAAWLGLIIPVSEFFPGLKAALNW